MAEVHICAPFFNVKYCEIYLTKNYSNGCNLTHLSQAMSDGLNSHEEPVLHTFDNEDEDISEEWWVRGF